MIKLAVKNGDVIDLQEVEYASFWKAIQDKLVTEKGILYVVNSDKSKSVLVPKQHQKLLCELYHDSITAGHVGFEKTFRNMEARFLWPGMKTFIYEYCKTCDKCQKFKQETVKANKYPLVSIKVNKIWDLICVDVAGPLKVTPKNNKYILVAIDHFSKFVVVKAAPSYTAEITINFLKEDVISKFGTPAGWLTDQGRNFEAGIFKEFCKQYNIKKLRTTGYHPQCNGLVERTIKTIKQMLCSYVNESHDNWDQILYEIAFSYNNNTHSTTGFAPNELVSKSYYRAETIEL